MGVWLYCSSKTDGYCQGAQRSQVLQPAGVVPVQELGYMDALGTASLPMKLMHVE